MTQNVSDCYPTTDVLLCASCGEQIVETFVIDNSVKPPRPLHSMCAAYDFGVNLRDARAEIARLREASAEALKVLMLSDPNGDRLRAFGVGVDGDLAVLDLCKRHGYGAVMDSAARQWRLLSDGGAHTTGACVATVQKAVARLRAALGEE